MTSRPVPFIGALRVPWLRPVAQVLRALALLVGGAATYLGGFDVLDAATVVVLVVFLLWRALPIASTDVRLRNVMALEVVLTTVAVAATGGWGSPWLLAQLVPIGLVALGLSPLRLTVLAVGAGLVTTLATALSAWPATGELAERIGAAALVVVFGGIARSVLKSTAGDADEALGRLDVLWSVRSLLEGLHTRTAGSGATFDIEGAVTALRASRPVLARAHVVALLALEPDGTLRRLHTVGLPDRTLRVRDLPSRAGDPRRDGVPAAEQLPGGGLSRESVLGAYLWLPVERDEPEHVLVVEYAEGAVRVDQVLPELLRVAQPLAITVMNAAWFGRVRHLGVDEERQRIAARLHDQFAQSLAVISMQLELAARRHPDDQELRELKAQVGETLGGLRDTMVELRASVTEDRDLPVVLDAVAARLRDRHGVIAELTVEGEGPRPTVAIEQQLLRTVQELTRRAVQERGAFAVYLRVERRDDVYAVEVADDGEAPGDEPDRSVADVVRDRAQAIGARVVAAHGGDGLSRVRVEIDQAGRAGEQL